VKQKALTDTILRCCIPKSLEFGFTALVLDDMGMVIIVFVASFIFAILVSKLAAPLR
jgi:hypothetical protein